MARLSLTLLLFTLLLAVSIMARPIPVSLSGSRIPASHPEDINGENRDVRNDKPQVTETQQADEVRPVADTQDESAGASGHGEPHIFMRGFKTPDLRGYRRMAAPSPVGEDNNQDENVDEMPAAHSVDENEKRQVQELDDDSAAFEHQGRDGGEDDGQDDGEHGAWDENDHGTWAYGPFENPEFAPPKKRSEYTKDPEELVKGFGHMRYHARRRGMQH